LNDGDGDSAGVGAEEGDAVCPEQPTSVTHKAAAAAMDITCFKVIRA
jgi:hypothetical protein